MVYLDQLSPFENTARLVVVVAASVLTKAAVIE